MAKNRRRHARNRTIAAIFAVSIWLAGCSETSAAPEVDRQAVTEAELVASGTDPEIAACVAHIGRRELRVGPLSDAAMDELLNNCRAAQDVIERTDDADRSTDGSATDDLAMVDASTPAIWGYGDDPVLDGLWEACESGIGAACDDLFDAAPVGSAYEDFGVSCGDRPDVFNCEELDLPEDALADAVGSGGAVPK